MPGNADGGTRVTVSGGREDTDQQVALAALCAAVERAVQAYRPDGIIIREVVVMLDEGEPEARASEPATTFVDVYDSGYGHGI